jgi:hypothetical protein
MSKPKINEDFLLLLIDNNGIIGTDTIDIVKHFENENKKLSELCGTYGTDNIDQIVSFIRKELQPKLPNKTFKYCKDLDKPYQSVHVNVENGIKTFLDRKDLIYTNQKLALSDEKEFDLDFAFRDLKSEIKERIELWFKVFDIEFAYDKAKAIPNVLSYSHRISGWSSPEYKITNNLKQEIKTNFGYGSVSYFFLLFTFKNIQITPLSEWIDYRYSDFSEIIRYTRSFKSKIPVDDERGRLRYYKTNIKNDYWNYAIAFTQNAANLSLTNEDEFVEKYIISECEKMVNGLQTIYADSKFDLIDENQFDIEDKDTNRHRLDIDGFKLVSFKTEKIIGALDFIGKIIEYNKIIPTDKYVSRIKELNKQFIPKVYKALSDEKEELRQAKNKLANFLCGHNKLIDKDKFYTNERVRLKTDFNETCQEFVDFQEALKKSFKSLTHFNRRVKLHSENIEQLYPFILKYNKNFEIEISSNDFTWELITIHQRFLNSIFSTYFNFNEIQLEKYYGKVLVGSPELTDGFCVIQSTEFGLIYNPNILWTEKLKRKYHKNAELVRVADYSDVYSFEIVFEKLPLLLSQERVLVKDLKINAHVDSYGSSKELGDYDNLVSEIECIENYYKTLIEKSNFTDEELLTIIKNENKDYIYNYKFYKALMKKIKKDIKDFSITSFFESDIIKYK